MGTTWLSAEHKQDAVSPGADGVPQRRSWDRHRAAAESEHGAIAGVLPLLRPSGTPAHSLGTSAGWRGTARGQGGQHGPLNHPVLPLHPRDQRAATTALLHSCTAAGGAARARSGVHNPPQLSTAAALWCQPLRAQILTPAAARMPVSPGIQPWPLCPAGAWPRRYSGHELGGSPPPAEAGSGAVEGQRERRGQRRAEGLMWGLPGSRHSLS